MRISAGLYGEVVLTLSKVCECNCSNQEQHAVSNLHLSIIAKVSIGYIGIFGVHELYIVDY